MDRDRGGSRTEHDSDLDFCLPLLLCTLGGERTRTVCTLPARGRALRVDAARIRRLRRLYGGLVLLDEQSALLPGGALLWRKQSALCGAPWAAAAKYKRLLRDLCGQQSRTDHAAQHTRTQVRQVAEQPGRAGKLAASWISSDLGCCNVLQVWIGDLLHKREHDTSPESEARHLLVHYLFRLWRM